MEYSILKLRNSLLHDRCKSGNKCYKLSQVAVVEYFRINLKQNHVSTRYKKHLPRDISKRILLDTYFGYGAYCDYSIQGEISILKAYGEKCK